MCGRYTLTTPAKRLAEEFDAEAGEAQVSASYNVAPSQEVAAVLREEGVKRLKTLRWGLVPSWADDPAIGNRMINARSETAHEKPSFRSAFKRRRCLIPADGFYEWRKELDGKQPFYITTEGAEPFAFAGLWESWEDGEGEVRTCAILTTEANETMREIHHRMPVILPAELRDAWLDEEADKEELLAMLEPYSGAMEAYPVSRFVNRPTNDDPRCVEPVNA